MPRGNGNYIWCIDNGPRLIPMGYGKSFQYAVECEKAYGCKVKLYQLVAVEDYEQDIERFKENIANA